MKLLYLPEYVTLPFPSAELPEKVRLAAEAVIMNSDDMNVICKHAMDLNQLDNGVIVPPSGWKCEKTDNLLTDISILCGRKNWDGTGGNNHDVNHYTTTKYPLAANLGTNDLEAAGTRSTIFVKLLDGTTIRLFADSSDNIEFIKGMIESRTRIPSSMQMLSLNGKPLENGKRLQYYTDCLDLSTIHLNVGLKGGTSQGKRQQERNEKVLKKFYDLINADADTSTAATEASQAADLVKATKAVKQIEMVQLNIDNYKDITKYLKQVWVTLHYGDILIVINKKDPSQGKIGGYAESPLATTEFVISKVN